MDRIRRAAAQVKELGMHLVVDFIIGVPTETEDDLKSVISLVKELHADDIFLFFLKYYPGTQILNYASQNGFLTPQQVEEVIEGLEFGMQMIPARIQGEQRAFYDRYNGLIREAAGSKFRIERFDYLLDNC
jgi:coproporphyrinogen III oxidase-like Fe-S oxidoreductase